MKANSKQTQNNVPSWGLARVSSTHTLPAAPANVNYTYDSTAGQGVTAYVIDSGIMINHTVRLPSCSHFPSWPHS